MANNENIRKHEQSGLSLVRQVLPGLNLQAPWSQMIVDGIKTVETRFYPLPKKYIGQEMALIETPGKNGKFKARVTGIVVFGEPFLYDSKRKFYADQNRHLVCLKNSDYNWDSGMGKKKWGWPIIKIRKIEKPLEVVSTRGIVFARQVEISIGS